MDISQDGSKVPNNSFSKLIERATQRPRELGNSQGVKGQRNEISPQTECLGTKGTRLPNQSFLIMHKARSGSVFANDVERLPTQRAVLAIGEPSPRMSRTYKWYNSWVD